MAKTATATKPKINQNTITPPASDATPPAIVPAKVQLAPVIDDSEFMWLLDSARFAQLQRVANMFADSDMVPDHFKKNPANCGVALQMAFRMKIDPMMLLQNMYIVHGRPGIEAKLAIALINSSGKFATALDWEFKGEGDKRSCTCFAIDHKGKRREQTVTWSMVVAEGWNLVRGEKGVKPKWLTLPDLMFQYRSAMFFGRLNCPEVLLGLHSKDELDDIARVERQVDGERVIDTDTGVISAINKSIMGGPVDMPVPTEDEIVDRMTAAKSDDEIDALQALASDHGFAEEAMERVREHARKNRARVAG